MLSVVYLFDVDMGTAFRLTKRANELRERSSQLKTVDINMSNRYFNEAKKADDLAYKVAHRIKD